jgi:hypothetical protein
MQDSRQEKSKNLLPEISTSRVLHKTLELTDVYWRQGRGSGVYIFIPLSLIQFLFLSQQEALSHDDLQPTADVLWLFPSAQRVAGLNTLSIPIKETVVNTCHQA